MSRSGERAARWPRRLRAAVLAVLGAATAFAACAAPPPAAAAALQSVGRPATEAEVKAWDIDVRGDFKGLPKGSGSVNAGADVWDAQCASCHGAFGESNKVFAPIVGGTSKKDIETGRAFFLANPGYPHRTTLMKASRLSSLWDYIHRAMPWTAPKSLKPDEVYAVLAYMLNLGEIVPADFTLTDKNIAEVEKRLPNRNGKVFYEPMWRVRGKGDVVNPLCMKDCPVQAEIQSSLPLAARDDHGNIAEQVRPFGPARGTDTSLPPRTVKVGVGPPPVAVLGRATSPAGEPAAASTSSAANGAALAQSSGCTACHGLANKIVGPALQDIAKKHAGRADAVPYLLDKIKNGGQGVWGVIPMPPQAHVKDDDAKAIADWLAAGAR